MTLHPRQPLTAEERAVAAQLPRLGGRAEPDARLDARILAAARAAAAPAPALRPRLRWIAPMAVAASLSLAVGLAWRLQPPAVRGADAPHAVAATAEMHEAPTAAPAAHPVQERHAILLPPEVSRPPIERAHAGAAQPASVATNQRQAVTPAPAPAPAPPAPPVAAKVAAADSSQAADMAAAPVVAPAPDPALAKARESGSARERPVVPRAQASAATQAADATGVDPQAFGGDEDVPPATVDSPDVREAWLRRIGELVQQGRSEDARASLAEFRRRYPDAPLPPELRKLEP